VTEPRILEFDPPEYPAAAREAGVEGTVRVAVLVGEDGRALEVRLDQGIDSQIGLEQDLVEAARRALYEPASRDGEPVRMWYRIVVDYPPSD
jgi:protein TonB